MAVNNNIDMHGYINNIVDYGGFYIITLANPKRYKKENSNPYNFFNCKVTKTYRNLGARIHGMDLKGGEYIAVSGELSQDLNTKNGKTYSNITINVSDIDLLRPASNKRKTEMPKSEIEKNTNNYEDPEMDCIK